LESFSRIDLRSIIAAAGSSSCRRNWERPKFNDAVANDAAARTSAALSPEALRPDIEAQGFMVKVWLVAH
jgi:hypothetical protein